MAIDTEHPQYKAYYPTWEILTLMDENKVKESPKLFLPEFRDKDEKRYEAYVKRALYVNFTGWTKGGWTGMVFRLPGTVELPEDLEYLREKATLGGKSLAHVMRKVIEQQVLLGRHGVLTEYSNAKQMAYFAHYNATNIIDWEGEDELTYVKLVEARNVKNADGEYELQKTYIELWLNDGVYTQTYSNEDGELLSTLDGEILEQPVIPTQADGSTFDFIPFQIFGSEDNDANVDKSPLLDIAEVNRSHFQNSADYEEALYLHSQGTAIFTSSWPDKKSFYEVNPSGFAVGSLSAVNLGQQGDAKFLKFDANSAAVEAMERKEEQMVAIGAKFISPQAPNETAETARIRASQTTSGLTVLVDNAEEGLSNLCRWAAMFQGANQDQIEIKMNRDFYDASMSAQEITALIMLRSERVISQRDVRDKLRKTDYIAQDRTDLEIDEDLANEM